MYLIPGLIDITKTMTRGRSGQQAGQHQHQHQHQHHAANMLDLMKSACIATGT